jgi:hypothetical protein
MSNLAPSSEYREAEETSSKIKAIAPSAPAPAGRIEPWGHVVTMLHEKVEGIG